MDLNRDIAPFSMNLVRAMALGQPLDFIRSCVGVRNGLSQRNVGLGARRRHTIFPGIVAARGLAQHLAQRTSAQGVARDGRV